MNLRAPQARRTAPLAPPVATNQRSHRTQYLRRLPTGGRAPRSGPVITYIDEGKPLDPNWWGRAVCKGKGATREGIKLWFPGPGGSHGGKKYCAVCPVRRECLKYSDDMGIEWGIWGGEMKRRT